MSDFSTAPEFLLEIGEDPSNPDHLLPELRPYLVDTGFMGPALKHPLVYQLPFYSWKMANERYRATKERVDAMLREGKFQGALWYYERPYRLTTLHEWYENGVVDHGALCELMVPIWMDTEFPHQFGEVPALLFAEAGYVSDTEERLTGTLTVYRGASRGHMGLSWTLDREKALWFAKRFHEDSAALFTGTVAADDIYGYFVGRGESEVVVEPSFVQNVKRIPMPPRKK